MMHATSVAFGLAAPFLTLLAVIILYFCWQKKKQNIVQKTRTLATLGLVFGWLILGLGAYAWSQLKGAEFGLTFCIIEVGVTAWILIAIFSQRAEAAVDQRPRSFQGVGAKMAAKRLLTFFLAGPLSMASACLLALVIGEFLATEKANQLVWSAFLFPVFWGLLSFWLCATPKRKTFCLTLFASLIGSGFWVFA